MMGFLVPLVALFFVARFTAMLEMKSRRKSAGFMRPWASRDSRLTSYLFLSLAVFLFGVGHSQPTGS